MGLYKRERFEAYANELKTSPNASGVSECVCLYVGEMDSESVCL